MPSLDGSVLTLASSSRQLEDIVSGLRLLTALGVLGMAVMFDPAWKPVAFAVAVAGVTYSVYSFAAVREFSGPKDQGRHERLSVVVDGSLTAVTYLALFADQEALPAAFLPLLVFELSVRFGVRGVLFAGGLAALTLGIRAGYQLAFVDGGIARPVALLFAVAVTLFMIVLARWYRAVESDHLSALREREQVSESLVAIIEGVLTRCPTEATVINTAEIRAAVREAQRGEGTAMAECIADLLVSRCTRFGLTPREYEIASLLTKAYSYARIADELYLSQSTVRGHVCKIKSKLSVGRTDEIAAVLCHGFSLATPGQGLSELVPFAVELRGGGR